MIKISIQIELMNKSRLLKVIHNPVRINGILTTWKTYIDNHKPKTAIGITSKVKWNRTKFNRMEQREQDVYSKQLEETKEEYRIITGENSYLSVKKFVFDYATAIYNQTIKK